MNRTSIKYSGSVKIDLEWNGKKFTIKEHNAGTHYFMKMIAKFITGNIKTEEELLKSIPKYLSVDRVDRTDWPEGRIPQESDWDAYVKQPIQLSSVEYFPKSDSSEVQPYSEFTATLTSSDLTDIITEVNENYLFRLSIKSGFDETNKKYYVLATLPVSQQALMKITPGTQATITWVMQFSNATPEEEQ